MSTVNLFNACREVTLEVDFRTKFKIGSVHQTFKARELDVMYYKSLSNFVESSDEIEYVNLNECYKYDRRRVK